jgi:hypothetical protein
MHPLHLVPFFFGGALLMNAVPHLVAGTMGQRFPTPFATPPGKGLSSSIVNMLWGFGNLVAAILLLWRAGGFDVLRIGDVAAAAIGMLLLGLQLAWHFGRLNGGTGPGPA